MVVLKVEVVVVEKVKMRGDEWRASHLIYACTKMSPARLKVVAVDTWTPRAK